MLKFLKKYLELKEKQLEIREKEMAIKLIEIMCAKHGISYPNTECYFNTMLSVIRSGKLLENLAEHQTKLN